MSLSRGGTRDGAGERLRDEIARAKDARRGQRALGRSSERCLNIGEGQTLAATSQIPGANRAE